MAGPQIQLDEIRSAQGDESHVSVATEPSANGTIGRITITGQMESLHRLVHLSQIRLKHIGVVSADS
jgi:hypothetical protein